MDTKPFFLPSEVARLVLGYLISQGFHQTSSRFLSECDYLAEFRKLKNMGLDYPTNIMGLSLVDILDNFGFMKTQALERYNLIASTDVLWRELDSCLDKLKYKMFQPGSNKFNVAKLRSHRPFPDRNVKVFPENIGEMILKQGKILSSKQLAQNMKKVHETIKVNDDLKRNPVEKDCTNVNRERQDLHRVPSIPEKELPVNVEDFHEVIEHPAPIPAKSNEKTQNKTQDKNKDEEVKTNSGEQQTTTAHNNPTSHKTESISGTSSLSQIPNCHESETAENSITVTITEASIKQPDSGNPIACVSTPSVQLPSSPVITETSAVEVEVTTSVAELGASDPLPLQVSDSECKSQPTTKSQLVYQSIGTQSDFSPVEIPPQPDTSPNKLYVTTPLEATPSTSTEMRVAIPSTPTAELSLRANTLLPSPMEVTSDALPGEPQDVSNQEKNPSIDSETAAAVASLSFSPSPPHYPLLKSFSSVYKTPVKNLQNPYRTPCKENSQSETLNTPTREKNTSFPESLTPGKQSESDNAKSKRKRCPPEKRFFDISVPGPSQVRHESGNSQDGSHLKDQIPTFVEKVITETSLAEVLAETINRKLYGETKSETTTKNNENKNVEDGQKVECDKLMDEIMLTDFHMTKSDIDEVIHQTSSAGIPVLDDLLKLFASVSEDCTEPVSDSVEFEGLDTCSESAQNKEIKLVIPEDDLSKSDLKTPTKLTSSEDTREPSSLSKPPTTFLQVVDKLCSSEASTATSSNPTSEHPSLKTFSTSREEEHKSEKTPAAKIISDSESLVKDLQTSSASINSSDNTKLDQASPNAKPVSIPKQPSSCSRRSKVFSKGKSRKLVAAPVLRPTNQNPILNPPNPPPPASLSSLSTIIPPSATAIPSDTPGQTTQSVTLSLAGDTPTMTTSTSESTTKTAIPPVSSSICLPITVTPTKTSPTNLTCSSVGTVPVCVSSELPVKYSPATASTSSFSNLTTTTTTTTTMYQTDSNLALLADSSSLSAHGTQGEKIISASISESSSVVSRILQPEQTVSLTKYPVMYIIAPPVNVPLQLQPTHVPALNAAVPSNFAYTNVQWPWTTGKVTTMVLQDSVSLQTPLQEIAAPQGSQIQPKKPRGRPKKDPSKQKPRKPKICNIAPNRDLNSLQLSNVGLQQLPQEKKMLAMSEDNTWTIEMEPGTEYIVLNLKSEHMNQFVNYQLTAAQVKDHLASFIGTSAITEHILKRMEELAVTKSSCTPSILSCKKIRKKKTPVPKGTCVKQPATSVISCQSLGSDHQGKNGSLVADTECKQIDNCAQEDEKSVLYVATSLGTITEFLERKQAGTKDSAKLITSSSSSASQMMQINNSQTSTLDMEKSSPNVHPTLSKEQTSVEKPDQKSSECINSLPLNLTKEVVENNSLDNNSSNSSFDNNSNRTIDTPTKDNEYLAINILSTLCYAQRQSPTKADPAVDVQHTEKKDGGNPSCDATAASPARCYKMLMGRKKDGKGCAPSIDLSAKPSPVLQEHYRDMSSDPNNTFGYVEPAVKMSVKGTPQMKHNDLYLMQGKETLVRSKEKQTDHKKVKKGSDCKKPLKKSCIKESKSKSVKRKLYEAFEEGDLSSQKPENKIDRTDIDLLLTKLHPDSSDGFDGNT